MFSTLSLLALCAGVSAAVSMVQPVEPAAGGATATAGPAVTRLTPPSRLFEAGRGGAALEGAMVSRFLPGQRFDVQATIRPREGEQIVSARFEVDGRALGEATLTPATAHDAIGSVVATLRAQSSGEPGVRRLRVVATQGDGSEVTAEGEFEVVSLGEAGPRAKNLIVLIGDGMGLTHRTAARLLLRGTTLGKADGALAVERMAVMGIVQTASLDSIITDSAPGASCYSTGNKANNGQLGVFPDDTLAELDNPRVELIGSYLAREGARSLGIVTTSDVTDATPAAFATHSQNRTMSSAIADQFFDRRAENRLRVLMGGGRRWFWPGGSRSAATDEAMPAELAGAWGGGTGAVDPKRDVIGAFQEAGWTFVKNRSGMEQAESGRPLLGLFAPGNMNVAMDKIAGRRGTSTVTADYGEPDQPMLDEMASVALRVLEKDPGGFVLMVEAASIDKQAHDMDSDRWMLEVVEFDRAVATCLAYAREKGDTLVVVTADHECGGVAIIGATMVDAAELRRRAQSGVGGGGTPAGGGEAAPATGGAGVAAAVSAAGGGPGAGGAGVRQGVLPRRGLREGTVGANEEAGFPRYRILADGYPETMDPDRKILINYAAGADRREDWLANPRPIRSSAHAEAPAVSLEAYPRSPMERDVEGAYELLGPIPGSKSSHTAADIILNAEGPGAEAFRGVQDNTDVFFKMMGVMLGRKGG